MKLPAQFTALLLAGSLALAVAACGTPTVDGAESRFKANKDKISVLTTKQPANKAEFDKKIAEFDKEHTDAIAAGTDEEKIKKLGALNSRMDTYIASVEKANPAEAAKAGGAGAPSNKLDGAGAPAAGTPPAAGGKLGGTAPVAPPASGGMGGTAPAQPASGGMGGGAPAVAPAVAPAAGGMGGM
jgi:septal ring factor EnvC (AmiA/AmiB activator)